MSLLDTLAARVRGRRTPVGTIHVVDRHSLNWLYITYNTIEELVRVSPAGVVGPAAMKSFAWADPVTLDITVRKGNTFPTGQPLTAATVKKAFDELMRWQVPHPPGSHFNNDPRTTLEVTGEYAVRMRFPEPDGLAVGKLRAMHLASDPFWAGPGFGYRRNGTGEGRW